MIALPKIVCRLAEPAELCADPADPFWAGIEPVELSEAESGVSPAQRTRVRTAWTREEWRVLFECEDRDPWATFTARDAPLFKEEVVEVFFDPVGDLESYYEIEVNPLGTVLDIVFRRTRSGHKGDWAWDCDGLRTLVRATLAGWCAEIAVPFASVGAPASWRANFCRIDRPSRDDTLPRELSAWSPPLRANFHTPERFGHVVFCEAI